MYISRMWPVTASVLIITLCSRVMAAEEEAQTLDLDKMAGLFHSEYDYSKTQKQDEVFLFVLLMYIIF